MGIDKGALALSLALGGLALGAKGHLRARSLNQYADQLNTGLPQGYKLPYQHRNFYFGDLEGQERALDAQAKARQGLYTANDFKTGVASQGYQVPFSAPENVSNYGTNVYYPSEKEDRAYQMKGQYGRQTLGSLPYVQKYVDGLSGGGGDAGPGPQQQNLPAMSSVSKDENGNTVLMPRATETVLPEIPENVYVTPEGVEKAMANATTRRGQDLTAQTAENKLGFEERKWNEDAPTRAARTRLLTEQARKLHLTNPYAVALLRSQINRNNRPPGGSGGGRPSSQESFLADVNKAVTNGWISQEDAVKVWKIKQGLEPREQNDSQTVTRDARGNVVSTSTTSRGGVGRPSGAAPTGGGRSRVGIGGGLSIDL